MINIIEITDARGEMLELDWLERAEAVHRELRPHLPQDYVATLRNVFTEGGRMCVATEGKIVLGVAVYRVYSDTFNGRKFYVDDLVTAESRRSQRIGHDLLRYLEEKARSMKCNALVLDSGTQRTAAHHFYFREGLVITAFNFKKAIQ